MKEDSVVTVTRITGLNTIIRQVTLNSKDNPLNTKEVLRGNERRLGSGRTRNYR